MKTTNSENGDSPAKRDKLEDAYLAIRERIISGEFPSGYTLIVNSLAQNLSLSTMPVREALWRLESEGWVISPKNKSAQVASFSDQEWLEHMQLLAVMEGYAVALAAPHMTQEDLEELRRINDAFKEGVAAENFLVVSNENTKFHSRLIARCPNAKLREDLRSHQERLNVMRKPNFTHLLSESSSAAQQHDQIIALLDSRAPSAIIEQLVREHKLRAISTHEQERAGS